MRSLASRLDRRVMVQRPVADDELDGAGSGQWVDVGECWADVQDVLPSRGEIVTGMTATMVRPARVRVRWRTDITPNMRFVGEGREMHIISGPAEIGRREALEFMVAEYIPGGNPA
ncbi:head-tail adaptor protein [Sphingomonas leidyi]|uniref:head-tail adaptor protein n=1 Tax=Sphingomonas leidyi TaxID=68569 RepID=UPI0036D3F429